MLISYSRVLLACLMILMIQGCVASAPYPSDKDDKGGFRLGQQDEGITVTPSSKAETKQPQPTQKQSKIAETDYNNLWLGALSAMSFTQIKIVNKDAGLISSDWYESKAYPGERFMVNVIVIKGTKPSPSSYRVTVKKQTLVEGRWVDQTFDHRFEYEIAKKMYNKSKKFKAAAKN